jgi:hypothetical protein
MKSATALARLVPVNLRDVFETEGGDFTPWLAQADNLRLLGETIGIELECEAQEKWVGPYRADILCRDVSNENWVLIENQIEKTDHIHLGQLLTYAAGLEAVTIVWVAKRFTDEHRAALDWLNEHTDENINFFGLEIELWKIQNSPVAPKFNVISQPNDWSRTVKAAATQSGERSEHQQLQHRFWVAFREFMQENSNLPCQKPSHQAWMIHTIGRSFVHLSSVISKYNSVSNTWDPEIRVELVCMGDTGRKYFLQLQQQREKIDKALGVPVTWYCPEETKQSRIYVRRDADFTDETKWPEQQEWLRKHLELFKKVLGPIVKELD